MPHYRQPARIPGRGQPGRQGHPQKRPRLHERHPGGGATATAAIGPRPGRGIEYCRLYSGYRSSPLGGLHDGRLLARLKGLRDIAFDIFGRPTERRAERQLIVEHLATVEELAQSLSDGKLDTAVALASLPDNICSFGHVKEVNMQKAAQRRTALLAQFRSGALSAAA